MASVTIGLGFWGLSWGLPSESRRELFLKPALRTPEFYAQLERLRTTRYNEMGMNSAAYAGRLQREGQQFHGPTDILFCYGSYLVRSHDADEQQTLVAVSRLNPLKGKWYPHAFYYGGGYIYPLAFFLGLGKVIGFVTLVPQVSFYYEHANEMGKIFLMLRSWSVVGLLFSCMCLYVCAKQFASRSVAFWSSLFFVLAPVNLAFSKIGKPHTWGPGWTLLAIGMCARFKESQRTRDLLLAAAFMGFAIGTTTSQCVFFPFLVWAIGMRSPKLFVARSLMAFVVVCGVFLVLNPTLPFHFQDFMDEVRFIGSWYPFKVRIPAIFEFVYHSVLPALTPVLFVVSVAGLVVVIANSPDRKVRHLLLLFLLPLALVSFQVQAATKEAIQIRIFLSGVALLSFAAAYFSFQFSWGVAVRWIVLSVLFGFAALYNLHFASDRAPNDNASLASKWIAATIPEGSTFEMFYFIPTPDQLPPVDFQTYKFVSYRSGEAGQKGNYLLVNPIGIDIEKEVLAKGYVLVKKFETSPLQKLKLPDYFSNANFPVLIYQKT